MESGAQRAIAEMRRMGVPIVVDGPDGAVWYELPDGTVVTEDPWYGEDTAPEGWFDRYGIAPEDRPKVKPRKA